MNNSRFKPYMFDGIHPYLFTDKETCIHNYIKYMLNRLQGLFVYEGLPDTIPKRDLELLLQCQGHATITQVDGNLYALRGGLGGEPNPYYMPTISVVANPALKYSATLKIDEDCIVVPNDGMYLGLLPLLNRYCTQLAENDVTMTMANINMRLQTIITAADDRTKLAAEKYIKDLIDGKLTALATNAFIEGIQTQPYAASGQGNQVTQLIEYEQFLKASMFNEIGIQMNWNAKRESIGEAETGMNEQALLPLIEDMYNQRKLGFDKVNELFGTNISIKFGYTWEDVVTPDEPETKNDEPEVTEDADQQGLPAEDRISEND